MPRSVASPLLDAAPAKRLSETEIASRIRPLAKLSDRTESLEQDMMELLGLVRSFVDPDRARPDEVRRDRPRRRRKLERRMNRSVPSTGPVLCVAGAVLTS